MRRLFYRWFPWQHFVRRFARFYGFIDPVLVLSRIHQFAQPSEIKQPLELLRAGIAFHARGLVNTQAIQFNLDWAWPHWVNRQFNPKDDAFLPRGFSITHVNLTHRNWTAIGLPGFSGFPLVDPAGLLTPVWDGWSVDIWGFDPDGKVLLPAQSSKVEQKLSFENGLSVETSLSESGLTLRWRSFVAEEDSLPSCFLEVDAVSEERSMFMVAFRPYNPEGISFIDLLSFDKEKSVLLVNKKERVYFGKPPECVILSDYRSGDVLPRLRFQNVQHLKARSAKITDDVGMATAAAIFHLEPEVPFRTSLRIPLIKNGKAKGVATERWEDALMPATRVELPDPLFSFLFEAAVRTLVLLSPNDVYPGPFTYKRFWFRDAAFILSALLSLSLSARVGRVLERFPTRQTRRGYFLSQEGEWDANGEALWAIAGYFQTTKIRPSKNWLSVVRKGADWIIRKRIARVPHSPHSGMLPAGFSAEHLGPSDYYYWDDFWGIAGLEAAAKMLSSADRPEEARRYVDAAKDFRQSVEESIASTIPFKLQGTIAASPYRRMDAGAIGSLVASYPLRLWKRDDRRIVRTADYLLTHCLVDGAFFQEMIHSGFNAYLTLHLAQVLLRAGDERYFPLIERVAELATPTGQWPEAIHPRTLGGCMGDGQHVWAAAEWVLMIRSLFLQEEEGSITLLAGIPRSWFVSGQRLFFGPTAGAFGDISIECLTNGESVDVQWAANWSGVPPKLSVKLPGKAPVSVDPLGEKVKLEL